jgi:hypothetical protein
MTFHPSGDRPMHCGRPLSSNFLSGILHRMQRPVMKSNLCPPACRSMAIAVLSGQETKNRLAVFKLASCRLSNDVQKRKSPGQGDRGFKDRRRG